jgi:hypothetical protein
LGRRWGQATITLTKIFFFGAISQLGVQEGALAQVVVDSHDLIGWFPSYMLVPWELHR